MGAFVPETSTTGRTRHGSGASAPVWPASRSALLRGTESHGDVSFRLPAVVVVVLSTKNQPQRVT